MIKAKSILPVATLYIPWWLHGLRRRTEALAPLPPPSAWGFPGTTMNKLLCCALLVSPWPRGSGRRTLAAGVAPPVSWLLCSPRMDGWRDGWGGSSTPSLSPERPGVSLEQETSFKLTTLPGRPFTLKFLLGYGEGRGALDLSCLNEWLLPILITVFISNN